MIGKRSNNDRKFPEANHQPRHHAKLRKEWALERQTEYDKLTLQQKLDRLAPEPHCKRQRDRLLALLEKDRAPKAKVVEDVAQPVVEAASKEEKKALKKYMRDQK